MARMSKLLGVLAEKGMSQASFAKELGLSEHTMSRIINMKSFLTTDKVAKACDILDIQDDALKAEIFLVLPS